MAPSLRGSFGWYLVIGALLAVPILFARSDASTSFSISFGIPFASMLYVRRIIAAPSPKAFFTYIVFSV